MSTQEKGTISVNTENIFPIIKKFLYSDHDIFLRELVSNAVDASQKIKTLASLGQYNGELGELKVEVKLDEQAKTITISDNGIGMTAEEVKKYINQIAFSGAAEFVEKFKNTGDNNAIIGKFGLGFYSAFMVSDRVEIITKSYQDAPAVKWSCTGSTEFELAETTRQGRGTDIILYINSESEEFLNKFRLRSVLTKYCKFLPIEVYFDGNKINETLPLWVKKPSELTNEDYLNFYRDLYPGSEEPLFWIHLNVDYPFNLTGVLYFPKIKNDITQHKNKIQLYSRQVFITDEVKDVVPEFLTLLHGVIDSPDIPLNVSRSYLQADANVKRINSHITKKVADKLDELFRNDRPSYEAKWDSVGLFVKYGMITDDKFYEKAIKFALLQNIEGKNFTIDEYKEKVAANQTDKNNKVVFLYTSDKGLQDSFIKSAQKRSYDVLLLDDRFIDTHFTSSIERKLENITLKRVDADTIDKLVEKDETIASVLSESDTEKVKEIFKKAIGDDKTTIEVQSLPTDEMPVLITIPEFMRRMQEMYAGSGMAGMGNLPPMHTVSINANHSAVNKLLTADETQQQLTAKYLYDLALLSQNLLKGAELTQFIERSVAMAI
jgi:molecular chaperone HtpG